MTLQRARRFPAAGSPPFDPRFRRPALPRGSASAWPGRFAGLASLALTPKPRRPSRHQHIHSPVISNQGPGRGPFATLTAGTRPGQPSALTAPGQGRGQLRGGGPRSWPLLESCNRENAVSFEQVPAPRAEPLRDMENPGPPAYTWPTLIASMELTEATTSMTSALPRSTKPAGTGDTSPEAGGRRPTLARGLCGPRPSRPSCLVATSRSGSWGGPPGTRAVRGTRSTPELA